MLPIRHRAVCSIPTKGSHRCLTATSSRHKQHIVPSRLYSSLDNSVALVKTKPRTNSLSRPKAKSSEILGKWRPSPIALQRLTDPLKLALAVQRHIRKGEQEKALELVRAASKDRWCTVSWNHIINDYIQDGSVNTAFKIFNEMRKRGQRPDSHTFTILFRGLAEHVENVPSASSRAITLLSTLQAPNSPVRPLNIHINAALEVCAKARDLDAVHGIVAAMPDKGLDAPNNVTYTIVLECLRNMATQRNDEEQYSDSEIHRQRQEAILQGKRIWADVVQRWRRGKILMDELLVSAMGRLLMLGGVQEHDEILSLIAQTTALERQVPPIGDPKRQTHLRSIDQENTVAEAAEDPVKTLSTGLIHSSLHPDETGLEFSEARTIFNPISSQNQVRSMAVPGNRILTLAMKACLKMHAFAASQTYWEQITTEVEPDLHNFHEYLRVLRSQRASRLALEMLRQVGAPKEQDGFGLVPEPVTFRLAMSVCDRDVKNPACLKNARDILELQMKSIKVPDSRTGDMLINIVQYRMGMWTLEEMAATMDSLDALWVNLKHYVAYGNGEKIRGRRTVSDEVSLGVRSKLNAFTASYTHLIEASIQLYRERLSPELQKAWNKRLERNRERLALWTNAGAVRKHPPQANTKAEDVTVLQ